MKYELNNKELKLLFEGELNSYNAENVEKEIDGILNDTEFTSLTLDFSELRYISSAGLRVLLKLKQKFDNTTIIEASLEVYDVLEMTGFTNIMSVKKALKKVYISCASIVGEGFFSTVYRIDKDTIIKVFNRTSDADQIERELHLAKQAFVLGIPTAISFDIVKVDDKLGVRFEMLDCDSLKNTFLKHPQRYGELVQKYADLLKKINTTRTQNTKLPDIKKYYFEKLEKVKDALTKEQYDKLYQLLSGIKDCDTFVHGDCHFKNIMVQGDELLLIDMDTLSQGHPIFELAAIYAPYIAFEEDDKGNNEKFLGVTSEFSTKLYNDVVNAYFGKDDKEIKDKISLLSYLHMIWWTRTNQPENIKRFEGCKGRLLKLLERVNDLGVGL